MKTLVLISCVMLSICGCILASTLTFDDIPNANAPFPYLTNGYQSLNWSNFAVLNAVNEASVNSTNGAYYGMVSISNAAFNAYGNPSEIDARGTNFNFLSAYLTGGWNSNLNIQVQGFRNGFLIFDQTVIASATNATLFNFGFLNIDRLCFNSFGGQPAFGPVSQSTFVMDNFTFEFIPEPSTVLLTGAGAFLLWAMLKRKRG